MENEFKVGDVVRLNSGGPRMTIVRLFEDTDGDQRATCTWFDNDKHSHEADFKTDALTK
jgi:uncharacterized protein YodC (DUF2158 family)